MTKFKRKLKKAGKRLEKASYKVGHTIGSELKRMYEERKKRQAPFKEAERKAFQIAYKKELEKQARQRGIERAKQRFKPMSYEEMIWGKTQPKTTQPKTRKTKKKTKKKAEKRNFKKHRSLRILY